MIRKLLQLVLLCLWLSPNLMGQLRPPGESWSDDCENTGIVGTVLDNNPNYNCNQYVRAALIHGKVNMDDGKPIGSSSSFSGYNQFAIGESGSNDFIKIGPAYMDMAKAKAANGWDHALVILNGRFDNPDGTRGDFASTPGFFEKLYGHWKQGHGTSVCEYDFYDTVHSGIGITGATDAYTGVITRYTLDVPSSIPYITGAEWEVDESIFDIIAETDFYIEVRPKNSIPQNVHNTYVRAGLRTAEIDNEGGNKPLIERSINAYFNPFTCSGLINSTQLYTWNIVHYYATNNITMNTGGWSWTVTSGTTYSWNVSSGPQGSGQNVSFQMPYGCINVMATNGPSNCSQTFTFCAYNSPPPSARTENNLTSEIDYKVTRLDNKSLVKTGCIKSTEDESAITRGLPPGMYVITVNGKRKKVKVLK